MSADFTIRQNDTKPYFNTILLNPDGTPAQLTGASIEMSMRHQVYAGSPSLALNFVSGSCEIIAPTLGQIVFKWDTVPNSTAIAGWYNCVFTVTYVDGTIESFPNNRFITVEVTPDL